MKQSDMQRSFSSDTYKSREQSSIKRSRQPPPQCDQSQRKPHRKHPREPLRKQKPATTHHITSSKSSSIKRTSLSAIWLLFPLSRKPLLKSNCINAKAQRRDDTIATTVISSPKRKRPAIPKQDRTKYSTTDAEDTQKRMS